MRPMVYWRPYTLENGRKEWRVVGKGNGNRGVARNHIKRDDD